MLECLKISLALKAYDSRREEDEEEFDPPYDHAAKICQKIELFRFFFFSCIFFAVNFSFANI